MLYQISDKKKIFREQIMLLKKISKALKVAGAGIFEPGAGARAAQKSGGNSALYIKKTEKAIFSFQNKWDIFQKLPVCKSYVPV